MNIRKRIKQHIRDFKTGTCNQKFLIDSKHYQSFTFDVVEKLPFDTKHEKLIQREVYYINFYDSVAKGYNLNIPATETCHPTTTTQNPSSQILQGNDINIRNGRIGNCNINLRVSQDLKDYLTDASWRERKNITQYLTDLIEADRKKTGERNV